MGEKKANTERRIDYSKEEIASKINMAPNSVDAIIKNIITVYGFEEFAFKRNGDKGRNFFPPEYTPLLIEILKKYNQNPKAKKRGLDYVNASDIIDYNKTMQEGISSSEDIPDFMKSIIQQMPWYRVSENIVDWTGTLIHEIALLIHNLFDVQSGNDLGEFIKLVCKELDRINYNIFRGRKMVIQLEKCNREQDEEVFDKIFEELDGYTDEQREEFLGRCPELRYHYDYKKGRIDGELLDIDRINYSIDEGIVSIIKVLMNELNIKDIQASHIAKLDQYWTDDEYKKRKMQCEKNGTEERLRNMERKEYLSDKTDTIMSYLWGCCHTVQHEFRISNGKKWKSIVEKMKDKEFKEDYYEAYKKENPPISFEEYDKIIAKPNEEMLELIKEGYLAMDENVEKDKELEKILNHFVGQMFLYFLRKRN